MPLTDAEIRQRIRGLIEGRDISCDTSSDTWGGSAPTTRSCAACGATILPQQTEIEVVVRSLRRTVFFHPACHSIWLEVCRELGHAC